MFLVSKEGHRVFTNRFLLSLYSPFLRDLFDDVSKDVMIGVSIPHSFGALLSLVKIITSGEVESGDQESLAEVGNTGSFLGIEMDNLNFEGSDDLLLDSEKSCDSFNFEEDSSNKNIKEEATDNNDELKPVKKRKERKRVRGPKPSLNLKCNDCEKVFSERGNFNRHALTHSGIKRFSCQECEMKFARGDKLKLHMTKIHSDNGGETFSCENCDKTFTRKDHLSRHTSRTHTLVSGDSTDPSEHVLVSSDVTDPINV